MAITCRAVRWRSGGPCRRKSRPRARPRRTWDADRFPLVAWADLGVNLAGDPGNLVMRLVTKPPATTYHCGDCQHDSRRQGPPLTRRHAKRFPRRICSSTSDSAAKSAHDAATVARRGRGGLGQVVRRASPSPERVVRVAGRAAAARGPASPSSTRTYATGSATSPRRPHAALSGHGVDRTCGRDGASRRSARRGADAGGDPGIRRSA